MIINSYRQIYKQTLLSTIKSFEKKLLYIPTLVFPGIPY